ncbi:MAG: putative DNA-binding domain-containing protein [Dechloromonas sp.]|nr:putative DNA-binding domain-containing protein [Dechloromonas sp.]
MSADFQDFQRAFGRHLRDPAHTPRPAGVPARRMAVYNELLFNNIGSFLDPCFPVCRELLGANRWLRFKRAFYRDWPLDSAWFRDIPRDFVRYLNSDHARLPHPRWLGELAHYEWAELAVDLLETPKITYDPAGDLLAQNVILNPALMNLAYHWPVHRIGPNWRPRKTALSCLIVYRDGDERVQFSEVNPTTHRLVGLLTTAPGPGRQALLSLASELQHPHPEQLVEQGRSILDTLRQQGIILGSHP